MGGEVTRDALQPSRADRVKPREFDRVEDFPGKRLRRPMLLVNPIAVESGAEREAIAGGSQRAKRRGVGARQDRVGALRQTHGVPSLSRDNGCR